MEGNVITVTWKVTPIFADENLLFQVLIRKSEYGTRGQDLPEARHIEIKKVAEKYQIDLYQALSLRRQILIWGFRQHKNFLSAGSACQQQDYANSFEQLAVDFLLSQCQDANIITEKKLKEKVSNQNEFQFSLESNNSTVFSRTIYKQITPDIIFIKPVIINGKTVNWIDCKAYYGAWIIHKDSRYGNSPLNKIPKQIERYNNAYGQGAILFLRGFHKRLADS